LRFPRIGDKLVRGFCFAKTPYRRKKTMLLNMQTGSASMQAHKKLLRLLNRSAAVLIFRLFLNCLAHALSALLFF
jgi:hypothetical protein